MVAKKIFTALCIVVSLSQLLAQKDNPLRGIENDLDAILKVTKAPGFAVAVVKGERVIYLEGYGYRDYEKKVPVDKNTLFAIGSSTKAFTAALLGQLRQEDKISFDDSPLKYIPELRFITAEMNSAIIVKDLMSHRTGLARHDYSLYFFPTSVKDSLLQRVAYQEPLTRVREQWNYNNFMYLAQGVIAERLTGKSWEENIRDRILQPLNMSRSNVSVEALGKSSNVALGYQLKKDGIPEKMNYYNLAGMSPAGSINSSASDMANWLMLWLNKGKFNGNQILSESYVNEAISSQMVIRPGLPAKEFPGTHFSNYGYGWFLSSYKGHYKVEHGGNIDGFSANVVFFPADDFGIVVLTNQSSSAVPRLVGNTIADRMLKAPKTKWAMRYAERKAKAKNKEEEQPSKPQEAELSHNLEDYVGAFENHGYGAFTVKKKSDSLFANFAKKKLYLKHAYYSVFDLFEFVNNKIDVEDPTPVRLNFNTNTDGEISSVVMNFPDAMHPKVEFIRRTNSIEVGKDMLKRYIGDFELLGTSMVIKVFIKNEDKLYIFAPGQPEYELLATARHKFSLKSLENFRVEFLESADNEITELLVIQPNGTMKAKRK